MNTSEDESLKKALGQWEVAASLSPRFQDGVWRRIERKKLAPNPWTIWQAWLEGVFARRAVAITYLAVLLMAGLTAGYVKGRMQEKRWRAQLAVQYVQTLDPDQRTRH